MLLVGGDAGVQRHAIYLSLFRAATLEAVETFPQADEHLLEEVVGLLPLVGEEVAHRVDGLPLSLHQLLEVAFLLFLMIPHFGVCFSL